MSQCTVLVVEDDYLLRLSATSLLRDNGCETLEAASADEALALLESGVAIDVVFTDVNMPGQIDGLELASAVRDRRPPIELIVTSGNSKTDKANLPEGAVFMAKPYSDEDLRLALAKLHLH